MNCWVRPSTTDVVDGDTVMLVRMLEATRVSEKVVVAVRLPDVPVIVTVLVPAVASGATLKMMPAVPVVGF